MRAAKALAPMTVARLSRPSPYVVTFVRGPNNAPGQYCWDPNNVSWPSGRAVWTGQISFTIVGEESRLPETPEKQPPTLEKGNIQILAAREAAGQILGGRIPPFYTTEETNAQGFKSAQQKLHAQPLT